MIVFSGIIGSPWGGILIGWWIAYPLGYRTRKDTCNCENYNLQKKNNQSTIFFLVVITTFLALGLTPR